MRHTAISKLLGTTVGVKIKNTTISSDKLRKRLLKEQIKEYKCECCNNSLWLN